MAEARASIGEVRYAVTVDADGHVLKADEPESNGGGNTSPSPYDLLLAGLGACTAITLRMYADRKQWDVKAVHVDLHFRRDGQNESIRRLLHIDGALSEEQRARMADIAERTPVTLTLKRGLPIVTELAPPSAEHRAAVDARLDEALEESFPASDPPAVDP